LLVSVSCRGQRPDQSICVWIPNGAKPQPAGAAAAGRSAPAA